jgi:Protein of unknown function (DUF2505)
MMSGMELTHELTYDAAPEEVVAMLADRAFREKVCEAMGSTRSDVTIDGAAGDGMRVVVDQTRSTAGVPSFAKRLVGDEVRLVRRESWSGASRADLTIDVPGKPATFAGAIALAARGDSTVMSVTGDVTVRIPMLGGRLEGLVADVLGAAFSTEERVGRAWLAGERG